MTQGSIKKIDRGLMNAKECTLEADAVDTDWAPGLIHRPRGFGYTCGAGEVGIASY